MGKDVVLSSILEKYRLQEPWLAPKPWESIASESGASRPAPSSVAGAELRADEISEAMLVKLALNALQGSDSALADIEKVSSIFSGTPADLSAYSVPNLWHRSVSTKALGAMLKSISHYGAICSGLQKFVDYFIGGNMNVHREARKDKNAIRSSHTKGRKKNRKPLSDSDSGMVSPDVELSVHSISWPHPPYSLINYGFSVGMNLVLQGYICAINTLEASIYLRRSSNAKELAKDVAEKGSRTSVVQTDITLLEVYLHTEELRIHIQALGTICMLKNAMPALLQSSEEVHNCVSAGGVEFCNFPRGADLLTYLYKQLQDTDPVHEVLLKFLFYHSFDPYYRLIRSWIYQASISDPYGEFIVGSVDDSTCNCQDVAVCNISSTLPPYEIHEGVSLPCFLKDVCGLIFRAGQQLQLLVKMLEFFDCQFIGIDSYGEKPFPYSGLSNLEVILPFWNCSSHEVFYSTLSFSKQSIEGLTTKRKAMYGVMEEQLNRFFLQLNTRLRKINDNVLHYGDTPAYPGIKVANSSGVSPSAPEEVALHSLSVSCQANTLVVDQEEGSGSLSSSEVLSSEMDLLDDDSDPSGVFSLHSYEERYLGMMPLEQHDFSTFSDLVNSNFLVKESSQTENLSSFRGATSSLLLDKKLEDVPSATKFSNSTNRCLVPGHTTVQKELHVPNASSDDEIPCCRIWPLGGLLRNPLLADVFQEAMVEKHFDSKGFEVSLEASTSHPWGLSQAHNVLSVNPMLARHDWLQVMPSRDGSQLDRLPYYDFSSVQDPCSAKGENQLLHTSEIGSQIVSSRFRVKEGINSGSEKSKENKDLQLCNGAKGDTFSSSVANEATSVSSSSGETSATDLQNEGPLQCFSGGAQWETMLKNSVKDCKHGSSYHDHSLIDNSEVPLDVVIDSCIVQEIFLQYKYISSFSVRLLEEGFDLHKNLLALRRYHFMEAADWADMFVISLSQHVCSIPTVYYCRQILCFFDCCVILLLLSVGLLITLLVFLFFIVYGKQKGYNDPNHTISVAQGLLESALQSSSCEKDAYKERLFIYKKEQNQQTVGPLTSSCGTHIYDFMALGYKVDWPVSIILTPEALKIYASIFGFLMKIKLAVSSLLDIWLFLKCIIASPIRQQLNHFLATLQSYVQSQLLHNAWWRFCHNLEYKVISFELPIKLLTMQTVNNLFKHVNYGQILYFILKQELALFDQQRTSIH
ncbi:Gamma-tubulin complex component 6 [Nymphaea thermarum]|nr:Gamma-tubulin complex component 6 [Nymphaea thermarum]